MIFGVEPLVVELWFGLFDLGSLMWDLWPLIFGLEPLVMELWFGVLGYGSVV